MIVIWFHNIKLLGKAAGCAQQIMAQEMLTNLNLEKSCFYKSLVLWVVIYSQNRTQSPWEFQKKLCTRQLAGTFSSYPYMGFGVCLQSRTMMLSWKKNNLGIRKPDRYLFMWSVIRTYLFRRVRGYSSGSVSSSRVQDASNLKPRLSLVSVQSFCVVSPHVVRAASLLQHIIISIGLKCLKPLQYEFVEVTAQVAKTAFESSMVHCHKTQDFIPK